MTDERNGMIDELIRELRRCAEQATAMYEHGGGHGHDAYTDDAATALRAEFTRLEDAVVDMSIRRCGGGGGWGPYSKCKCGGVGDVDAEIKHATDCIYVSIKKSRNSK